MSVMKLMGGLQHLCHDKGYIFMTGLNGFLKLEKVANLFVCDLELNVVQAQVSCNEKGYL